MAGIRVGGTFITTCKDKWTGEVKWSDTHDNVVVSTGLMHILDLVLTAGDTREDSWYIGLMGDTGVTTADKMSTHGFAEVTAYSESTRVAWVEARSGVSVSNSGNLATFTIDADNTTIDGAFLGSSENAGGTAGILLCASPFTGGAKSADSGDKLEVTYTFTAADA